LPATDGGASAPETWDPARRAQWRELQQVELPALKRRMRMRELGEFAQRLAAFADEAGYPGLQVQAAALKSSIDNFDVESINHALQRISALTADFDDT